jgi:hypothetical protein
MFRLREKIIGAKNSPAKNYPAKNYPSEPSRRILRRKILRRIILRSNIFFPEAEQYLQYLKNQHESPGIAHFF